ncbi:MAG TPA: hypothetical protein DD723_09785 [Candidatus Omnitrophica bacterium]|nr:MAG: hypothetical protein A2Z81_03590 [Omnitrophica WOR_2 bacterium GWA2_45_18]HBR15809.1 hypothetical protein [Candidatus Omnitrophota bacterium]
MIKHSYLVYDGHCQFCLDGVRRLKALDRFRRLQWIDLHEVKDLRALHSRLTKERAMSQLHVVESPRSRATSVFVRDSSPEGNKLYGGFYALRRLCLVLPGLYPLIPFVYIPGMGFIGSFFYRLIAKNRYLFHRHSACKSNSCFRE